MLTLSKREQNALRNKEALLNAAIYIVQNYGASKLTIQNLCEVARISNGSFYNLFKTKEDLVAYYLRHAFQQAIPSPEDMLKLNPIEKVIQLYEEYIHCCEDAGYEFVGLFYSTTNNALDMIHREPEDAIAMNVVKQAILDGCEEGFFKQDIDIEDVSFRIAVISTGVIFYWCASKAGFDLVPRLTSHLADYLQSLRA